MCFSEGQRATKKGALSITVSAAFPGGNDFFHQQYTYPVTKRHKPMLFPTALLLIIYEIFAWRFVQTQNFFGSTSLAFEYNSTDDYRILKGANSISFRSTVRVLSTDGILFLLSGTDRRHPYSA